MKKKLILFIPISRWEKLNYTKQFDEIVDLSNIEIFIAKNPLLWEDYFREYSSTKIGKDTILNLLQLDSELNTWFYNKFPVFYENRKAFYELQYLREVISEEDNLTIVSDNLNISFFNKHNVTVINTATNKKKKKKYSTVLKYAFVFAYRILISYKKKISKRAHFQLYQIASERNIASIKDVEKSIQLNGTYVYLNELFPQDFGYIEDIAFPSLYKNFNLNKRILKTKYKNTYTNEYILFKSLVNSENNKRIKKSQNQLDKNIQIIEKHLHEPEQLLIINHLKKLLPISKLYIRKYYAYDLFFRSTKNIKSVMAYAENLSQSKIVLDAASNNQIKTFGLQHGIIRVYNVGYNISKLESSIKPMPDITFVWGNYWKQQLVRNANYKENSIKIVGQPRADIIPKILDKYNRNRKLITFFSQLQPDLEEKYASAKSFITVAKNHPSLEFVIKLHPAEIDDIYSKLISEIQTTNVTIDYKRDTFQLLAESGIIMTCYSTVGAEALCFKTPLINFDSQGRDIAGYIEDKISYWVKNTEELNEVISKYKNNNLPPISLDKYILNTSFTLDGNTCKRIRDEILED